MLTHPQFDPVLFAIGPLAVRWYGIMYLLGFLSGWLLGRRRVARSATLDAQDFDDIVTWIFFGVVIGGRLGYVLFYDPLFYLANPLAIFQLHHGGMSFHGGLIGVVCCACHAARRRGRTFFQVIDFIAPLVPPGLFFGRLGNFINGELWGRVTSFPLGMVFPGAGPFPRHASQLYEALLEGVVLFGILWAYSAKPRPRMAVSGVFSLGYGTFRFLVEFFREPDSHLGLVGCGMFSMGQLLCLPMIALGIFLLCLAYRKEKRDS